MKVYLLYVSYFYDECAEVEGIYSTREKAEEARSLISPRHWSFISEEVYSE